MNVTFSDQIEQLEAALEQKREQLEELKAKRHAHDDKILEASRAIQDLRAVLRGEVPPSKKSGKPKAESVARKIEPVEMSESEGSDRPKRGQRRDQIIDICELYGAGGTIFRTADVLDVLRIVEDDITPGIRSYTYAVMNDLRDDGKVVKKGRGKWRWTG